MSYKTTSLLPVIKTMRRNDVDALKGIAIIAVVLYHIGIARYGYLGVDVFLVTSGFLLMNSLKRQNEQFRYFQALVSRLTRLYPLIIIAASVCLVTGFFVMLPDDYDSLSQSVVATILSANNVLACITTGNYWEVVNELKPLMHTWYIGVLVQFYVVFLFIYKVIINKTKGDHRDIAITVTLFALTFASLSLYLFPYFDNNIKFYLLPFRFYELSIGCLLFHLRDRLNVERITEYLFITLPILLLLLFIPLVIIPDILRLILAVICTGGILLCSSNNGVYAVVMKNKVFCAAGKASFSIYLWHQIILAFTRYTVTADFNLFTALVFFFVTAAVSVISYVFLENKLGEFIKEHYTKAIVLLFFLSVVLTSVSFFIYLRAGVINDIPELEISVDNITRGMHSKYNHRIYALENKPFANNDKINVLVVGNSYARDMANVLLESDMSEKINISYAYSWSEELLPIIMNANYIFSQKLKKDEIPQYVWDHFFDEDKIFCVGTKRYGINNGIIYSQRYKTDYINMRVTVPDSILKTNDILSQSWGNNYINFIKMVQNDSGSVPVFTPDGKYISQDCWHLTKAGAKMYAKLIDWTSIFD